MGDFNEVRSASERLGSHFCHRSASVFNEFILSTGIFDLPMGGTRFTRMNSLGSKLSKIDRILVSKHFLDKWPNSHTLALTREFSDHSPILLLNSANDYGPTPFKIDEIDLRAEKSLLTVADVNWRINLVKALADLEHHKLKDLKQKSKIKWALEGDVNSNFFHGIINNRRKQSRINGLAIDGLWMTDPITIKSHIL
ncbi:cytochrome P450 [Tanacetum coccineum]